MKDHLKFFDKLAFTAMLLLTLVGVVLIYSAAHPLGQPYHWRQLLWLAISLIAFFVVFSGKVESYFRYGLLLYGALCLMLVVQILFSRFTGRTIAGTAAWTRIGGLSMQFSELVKVPVALLLAKFLTTFDIIDWRIYGKLLLIVGAPVLLIVLQPDMGVSFILLSYVLIAILLKGIRWQIVAVTLIVLAGIGYVGWKHYLKPYQKSRLVSFVNPEKFKESSGYHVIQSRIAIGSGGLTGKGYLKGSQSQYQFLPTRHTDFIISVAGEEFGFMGISFLFMLYFVLFYRQFRFKFENDEEFYFIFLFNGLIFFQFLINTCVAIGLFPVLGIPLPFVSAGGSSLLSFYIGEAIIFKIKINSYLT